MSGRRVHAVLVFVYWGVLTLVASLATSVAIKLLGRAVAPAFGDTMVGLLVLVGAVVTVWFLCSLAVNIVSAALFALILVRLFLTTGPGTQLHLPVPFTDELEIHGKRVRVSWTALVGGLAVAVVMASGLAYLLTRDTCDGPAGTCNRASWCVRVGAGEHSGGIPARGRGARGLRGVGRAGVV